MSTSCGKQWRSEFVTVPPCFSFCDVQLSGGNFLKPRAKVKNVVTALQFFRAAVVTQLMKHFATTMVHGLFRDGSVSQKKFISKLLNKIYYVKYTEAFMDYFIKR